MSIEWLDHRTLLSGNILVAVLFSVLLFVVHWNYPRIRGTLEAALAFLVCVPGGILMAMQSSLSFQLSVVFADVSVLLFSFLCYLAITRFLMVPGYPWLAWAVTLLPIASIAFFTFVHDSVVSRMVSLGFSVGMLRLLTGLTLYRHPAKRRIMRAFAVFLLLSAVIAFRYTTKLALHGNPADFYQGGHVAVANLLFSLICFSLTGIFFVAIFGDELTAIVGRRAQVDPLTGVLNRQGISLRFATELNRSSRNHQPLSILLIDIDHFKAINDTHGHLAGDEALRHVTQAIQTAIRTHDLLGRFGGDEFLVLLPDTSSTKALEIAQRICSTSGQNQAHSITLSIGLAEAILNDRVATLVDRADAALYEAKRDGRNCVRSSRPSRQHAVRKTVPVLR